MKKRMIFFMMLLLSVSLTACRPSMEQRSTEDVDPVLTTSEITVETETSTESDFDEATEATEVIFDPTELVLQKKVAVGYRTESQYAGRFTEEYRLYLEQISGYEVEFMPFEGSMEDAWDALRALLVAGATSMTPDILVDYPLYGTDAFSPVIMDFTEYFNDPEKSAVFWRVLESCTTEALRAQILEHMHEQDKITIFPANVFTPHPNGVWNLQIRCLVRRKDQRAVWDFLMVVLEDAVTGYDA